MSTTSAAPSGVGAAAGGAGAATGAVATGPDDAGPDAIGASPAGDARADTAAADVADAVWSLLGAIRRLKSRRAHTGEGLGTGELRVLGQLGTFCGADGASTPVSIGELGRSAGLNPASTSATVDRLEADGLATRVRDTDDRRVVRVALTPEGRETVARRVAAWQAEWAEDLAELPAEDLAATARTLAAIAAHLDAR
ncbi:MarR family winged helix-turn-helix transcriptional regulator [Patulibacter minatonensis]|uniref:MarR family winged helix-turn-helix transcriptional regulator n=1 Tax=Patulibacter minatonensis TaxID=298163 RepID=UPI0004B740B7|nr:MarR family transcriptional regulator [Patulibacter minatonensis]